MGMGWSDMMGEMTEAGSAGRRSVSGGLGRRGLGGYTTDRHHDGHGWGVVSLSLRWRLLESSDFDLTKTSTEQGILELGLSLTPGLWVWQRLASRESLRGNGKAVCLAGRLHVTGKGGGGILTGGRTVYGRDLLGEVSGTLLSIISYY